MGAEVIIILIVVLLVIAIVIALLVYFFLWKKPLIPVNPPSNLPCTRVAVYRDHPSGLNGSRIVSMSPSPTDDPPGPLFYGCSNSTSANSPVYIVTNGVDVKLSLDFPVSGYTGSATPQFYILNSQAKGTVPVYNLTDDDGQYTLASLTKTATVDGFPYNNAVVLGYGYPNFTV